MPALYRAFLGHESDAAGCFTLFEIGVSGSDISENRAPKIRVEPNYPESRFDPVYPGIIGG